MFPVTIQVHSLTELQRIIAALEPTTEAAAPKADNKPKAKAEPLTATQTAAMDDTAGLEPTTKKPAAATARTEPTASVEAAAAPGKTASASAQPAASAEAAPQALTAATDKPVTYADLQAAVLKLHKADATAAKPIAEAMGFANFKAMPEDKWAAALAAVQAALIERGVV